MKLSEWLDIPNADGSRKRRDEFAGRISVTPQMISAYCAGTIWPSKPTMQLIMAETGGSVTPNDFIEMPHEAAQ